MSHVDCEHIHAMVDALATLASDPEEVFLSSVASGALKIVEQTLRSASKTVTDYSQRGDNGAVEDSLVTPEKELANLTEMAAIAFELDKTGDPLFMKQAAVLDEILLTIGAERAAVAAAKKAQDEEIARLKALAEKEDTKDPYTVAKKFHDKDNHVAEGQAAISKVKEYRPMEAPLNTRTCPDHPGAQMARIAENTYQCSLDKGIYNYENGYTTMKGNKIPGGDVSNQTQALHDRPNEFTSFETRESKLNPTA